MSSDDPRKDVIALIAHLYKQMGMPVPESYPDPCAANFELDGQLCITLQSAGTRLVMWCDLGAHPSVSLKEVLQLNSFSTEAAPFILAMSEETEHLVAWIDVPHWTLYEMQGQSHGFFSTFSEACFQLKEFLQTPAKKHSPPHFFEPVQGVGRPLFLGGVKK